MPKPLDPTFLAALQQAIVRFKTDKKPLMKHHVEAIALVESVLRDTYEHERALRERLEMTCADINRHWRNWLVSSLLVDYVKAVLADPAFSVARLYETYIDHQAVVIQQQANDIHDLTKKNYDLNEGLPEYVIRLQENLAKSQDALQAVQRQLDASQTLLTQQTALLTQFEQKLAERDARYQELLNQYLTTLHRKSGVKKEFSMPSNASVNTESSAIRRTESNVASSSAGMAHPSLRPH